MPELIYKQNGSVCENIFRNMSDGFARFEIITSSDNEPVDFVIREVNPAFESITGKKASEIVGKPLLENYPRIAVIFSDWLSTILRESAQDPVARFYKFIPQIYKLIDFTVFKEKDGLYYTLFHEMTQYRQEAGVIKNMVDGIIYYQQVFDENGNTVDYKILNVNPAFERLMRTDRNRIVGKLVSLIFPAAFEDFKLIFDAIDEVVTTEQPKTYEYYMERVDKWFSITLFCPNKGYGAATLTDISKFKLLQNALTESQKIAEDANDAKSELLTNISHELRTPLNVILSATQLFSLYLGDDRLYKKENASRHIKTMRQNCLRLIRLVNNIIDSNKIDSGLFKLNMKNHDLVNVIKKIVDSTEEYAHMKGNRVIFSTNEKEKIMAFDINAMERIMLNLLSNAFKFTKTNGNINVSINCEVQGVTLSVKDRGIGIPEDKRDLVFERFKQASSFITRESEGSGLGLAITKTLIDMHDGMISVKSEEGEGSEFIIRLPCRILNEKNDESKNDNSCDRLVERINIEFSDIYL